MKNFGSANLKIVGSVPVRVQLNQVNSGSGSGSGSQKRWFRSGFQFDFRSLFTISNQINSSSNFSLFNNILGKPICNWKYCLPAGQHMKKSSLSESSSDIMELEEGILLPRDLAKKHNCNPRHNNNINTMSIETDVWLLGKPALSRLAIRQIRLLSTLLTFPLLFSFQNN